VASLGNSGTISVSILASTTTLLVDTREFITGRVIGCNADVSTFSGTTLVSAGSLRLDVGNGGPPGSDPGGGMDEDVNGSDPAGPGCGLVSCSRGSSELPLVGMASITLGTQPVGRAVVVLVFTIPKRRINKIWYFLTKIVLTYCEKKLF
jgi:hypothetical protein